MSQVTAYCAQCRKRAVLPQQYGNDERSFCSARCLKAAGALALTRYPNSKMGCMDCGLSEDHKGEGDA